MNPNHVELILYAPGRLAWSRKSGSITSVAVAKCDLRRPGSHTFMYRDAVRPRAGLPLRENGGRAGLGQRDQRSSNDGAVLAGLPAGALRSTCRCRRGGGACATSCSTRCLGSSEAKLVYLTHWLQWRVLKLTLALYVASLVCGFFNPIGAAPLEPAPHPRMIS